MHRNHPHDRPIVRDCPPLPPGFLAWLDQRQAEAAAHRARLAGDLRVAATVALVAAAVLLLVFGK